MVTCPLVPDVPHLRSGSCTSPRAFGLGFLQTPPHDDALALLLTLGSANTWYEDLHLASSVPCLAHTCAMTREEGTRQSRGTYSSVSMAWLSPVFPVIEQDTSLVFPLPFCLVQGRPISISDHGPRFAEGE